MFEEATVRVNNHPLINNNEYELLIEKNAHQRSDQLNNMFNANDAGQDDKDKNIKDNDNGNNADKDNVNIREDNSMNC